MDAPYSQSVTPMQDIVIELKDLEKIYDEGTPRETRALRGITLRVRRGEIVVVFGPSGSGKSTLLNILSGLDRPTSGSVIIEGKDLMQMSLDDAALFHQKKVGMVFQAYELIASLSVLQNITMPARLAGTNRDVYMARGRDLLHQFELEALESRLPTKISGGQQQRVGIMRAFMNNPAMIVADEPTGNLDSTNAAHILNLFLELNEKTNTTMIIVSHDPTLHVIADRVVIIKDGKVERETKGGRTKALAPEAHTSASSDQASVGEAIAKPEKGTNLSPFALLVQKRKKLPPADQHILSVMLILLTKKQQDDVTDEQVVRLFDAMRRRIAGEIAQSQLQEFLDRSVKQGGVGLYRQTAEHVASNVEAILSLSKHVS
ncbi:MAG: hypothetical protein A3C02_03900 [Candidatus Andersenbacteria bacterium RIFCSPHIGHO2_02_FULL_45_11]|uniref:ABC transporter domain-containing protein n=1 Tax=Candidatus Andersenbacteria bacterium RIFCSPHIGHO2_12_FULL_45_11 TaxID=1797281 RepID=A0A1G1WZB2_9BACT|nr:MAG: hypothetical protein A2805_00620 [Candidatus Andersenbacteria bacterium RIFCSPHIGHO2_01_FULL_46_36]OGY33106.1 MAG: hypothetical protein A3D99_01455 [Candidatus Andersenbacteria bacterium RIFCSPHIGHO2_12_FULL_45_11]OGY33373.1 MAG: hypothetical protein A3C02_03900 [Candidatus Andersenbacteria bacterium RIFCSPHIGHO2_02_FULL_45_11]